jgi:hypothetical protein
LPPSTLDERFRAVDYRQGGVSANSPNQQVTFLLECVECDAWSDDGRGWKAYLDEDSCDVWVYCAACARREFGGA